MPFLSTTPDPETGPRFAQCSALGAHAEEAIRVALVGELDVANVPETDRALRRAEAAARLVVLDLRGLEFIDDGAAALILAAGRRIQNGGRPARRRSRSRRDRLAVRAARPRSRARARRLAVRHRFVRRRSRVTYCIPSVREIPVVAVEGEIDAAAASVLQRRLAIAMVAGRGFVAVDLRAVGVEGEHAVGLLCDALRDVDRHGTRLGLAASPVVGRVLERSAIDGVELYPTLGAAVAAAGRSPRPRPVAPTHVAAVSS